MMHEKKIVVFDFDGTLVDSMERLTKIAEEVMSRYFDITREEARNLYQMTSGLPFPQQLSTLYPKETHKRQKASHDFDQKKRAHYFKEPVFPDTHETLNYLRRKKLKVIISSNSEQDLVEKLVKQLKIPCDLALGFKDHFAKGLPHFLYILERWGGNLPELVFVGDSIKDGERAFESGIDFIAKEGLFTREQFQKRFPGVKVISQLAELKKIF